MLSTRAQYLPSRVQSTARSSSLKVKSLSGFRLMSGRIGGHKLRAYRTQAQTRLWRRGVWRIIWISHHLYGTHENSIPFLHRDLTAAYFTSLSLLNRSNVRVFIPKKVTLQWAYISPVYISRMRIS